MSTDKLRTVAAEETAAFTEYDHKIHRWGRLSTTLALITMYLPIIGVCLRYHVSPDWAAVGAGCVAILVAFGANQIIEPFTFAPMLGAGGTYMGFTTGNVSQTKIPCVVSCQEPVLQTGILVSVPALVDLKGQLVVEALAQHLDFLGHDFNVAGGQLGILALPLPDGAGDGDGGFLIDGLDQLHHVLGLHHHLSGAVVVPQHQEGKVGAHFPDIFQPADDGHFLACVPEPQLAAGIRSGLLHKKASLVSKFNAAIFSQIPEKVNRRYCFLRATLRKTDGFAFADNIAFMGAIVRRRR